MPVYKKWNPKSWLPRHLLTGGLLYSLAATWKIIHLISHLACLHITCPVLPYNALPLVVKLCQSQVVALPCSVPCCVLPSGINCKFLDMSENGFRKWPLICKQTPFTNFMTLNTETKFSKWQQNDYQFSFNIFTPNLISRWKSEVDDMPYLCFFQSKNMGVTFSQISLFSFTKSWKKKWHVHFWCTYFNV